MSRNLLALMLIAAVGLAGCGKKDDAKTREQQRAERDTFIQQREERAMQNPGKVFGQARSAEEKAARRSADHRKKVDEELMRKEREAEQNADKNK